MIRQSLRSRSNAAWMLPLTVCSVVVLMLSATATAWAQIDLSGSWSALNAIAVLENGPGQLAPGPVDYSGLPYNASGQAAALLSNDLQISEPERICAFYPPTYLMLGPFGLKIWNTTEPRNGGTVAWNIGGWEDRPSAVIWMDGRSHPSSLAPHEMTGFATGTWQDDVLVATFTHMRTGIVRRNLAPSSDRTTMTLSFFRHDASMMMVARIVDPVYFSQPLVETRNFELQSSPPQPTAGAPCTQSDEGVAEGQVPFFLPGENPNTTYMSERYGIPAEASLGGAQTMYPQYRKFLKRTYVRPAKCFDNQSGYCGGPPKPRN